MTSSNLRLCLYFHTHWDREWYWAFERYRTQLLTVMRLVVKSLATGDLPHFLMDGQVAALEDFLEVEPAFELQINDLVNDGKLSVGPWYVLADQMLVGGESLLRNMEFGMKRSRRFGAPTLVGYCPDTFGHTQDMPRILKGFGINSAVVWRGVPELDEGPEFFWASPDGSEVVATLLAKGYHQTLLHEAEGNSSAERIDLIVENILPWLGMKLDRKTETIVEADEASPVLSTESGACLLPVGGDHQKPPQNLAEILYEVQKRLDHLLSRSDKAATAKLNFVSSVELQPIPLKDYLKVVAQAVQRPAVPVRMLKGELRDNASAKKHAAAYMLAGVLSTRLYLKRANRLAEHRIQREMEPLHALFSLNNLIRYPHREFDNAWQYLLRNQPHDSICGCSVDAVHREMMTRFASLDQVLDVLEQRMRQELLVPGAHEWSHPDRKKQTLAANLENAGFARGNIHLADPDVPLSAMAVFNTSTYPLSAPVKITLPIPATFVEKAAKSSEITDVIMRDIASKYLQEAFGSSSEFQLTNCGSDMDLFGESGGVPLYKDVYCLEGWLWPSEVPALGVAKIAFANAVKENAKSKTLESAGATRGANRRPGQGVTWSRAASDNNDLPVVFASKANISNGIFEVRLNKENLEVEVFSEKKTYKLNHVFRDVADAGDSYNFDPVLNDRPVQSRLKSVEVLERGPLVGSIKITYEINIPTGLVDLKTKPWHDMEGAEHITNYHRARETITHEIETVVSLRRGVPIVFFDTTWSNHVPDHRLEVVFSTGAPVKTTWSENHMSLVKRQARVSDVPLPVEKYTESPLDRNPCQRFFVANGQAFFNLGLPEYAVDGDNVSITVLRAISMLSRRRLLTRGGGAGPYMAVPDGNCLGVNQVSYGWAPLAAATPSAKKASEAELNSNQRSLAYRLADSYEGTLWASPITGLGEEALPDGSLIKIENPSIARFAMYSKSDDDGIILRLLNVTDEGQVALVTLPASDMSIEEQDLAGATKAILQTDEDGKVKISFGANELITLKLG